MSDDPLHAVNVVCDEGNAFLARHPDIATNEATAGTGALMWGLLRALMECPDCPGHFRVPLDKDWDQPGGRLYCEHCGGIWIKQEPPPPSKKRKRHAR